MQNHELNGLETGSRVSITQGKSEAVAAVVRARSLGEISLLTEQRVRTGGPVQIHRGGYILSCSIAKCRPGGAGRDGFIVTAVINQ